MHCLQSTKNKDTIYISNMIDVVVAVTVRSYAYHGYWGGASWWLHGSSAFAGGVVLKLVK